MFSNNKLGDLPEYDVKSINNIEKWIKQYPILGSGYWGKIYDCNIYVVKEVDLEKNKKITKGEFISSLRREAKFNQGVHGIGNFMLDSSEKTAFLVMKKLPLSFQAQEVKLDFRNKYYSTRKAFVKLFLEILQATDELHTQHGIVHNDLFCGNILIDEKGSAKLCDFGNAYFIGEPIIKMTLANHHAPELKNMPIEANPNQDVYSLGWLLLATTNKHRWGDDQDPDLKKLGNAMTNPVPHLRPSLTEVIKHLNAILLSESEPEPSPSKGLSL